MTTIDTYVQNLHVEYNRALNEQRAILDAAAKERRETTAEEKAVIARTDEAMDRYDAEIKGWLERAERDKERDVAKAAYEPIQQQQASLGDTSFDGLVKFMRGRGPGNAIDEANGHQVWDIDLNAVIREKRAIRAGGVGADLLQQVLRNDPAIRAALSPDSTTAGRNTMPTDFERQLYDYLETYAGMLRAGPTVINTDGGNPLEFPKVATGGTAVLVGAGTAIAGSDPTFGKVTLGAWKYGEIVRVYNELLSDTGVDLEGFLARDLGRAVGRAVNTAWTTGNGSGAPTGLMQVIGTAVTGATGGTGIFTLDNLIDLEYAVDGLYAENNAVWMMRRSTIGRARKLKDLDGQYLWQPSNIVGQPSTLDGYPVVENPAVAAVATSALCVTFGDHSAFYIRMAGGLRIARSTDRYFDTDETAWRATLRTDSNLIDLTGAVKAYRGGTA